LARRRQAVCKVVWIVDSASPCIVFTSLTRRQIGTRPPFGVIHRARGEPENRVKNRQPDLFANRTLVSSMLTNQLARSLSPDSSQISRRSHSQRQRCQPGSGTRPFKKCRL